MSSSAGEDSTCAAGAEGWGGGGESFVGALDIPSSDFFFCPKVWAALRSSAWPGNSAVEEWSLVEPGTS